MLKILQYHKNINEQYYTIFKLFLILRNMSTNFNLKCSASTIRKFSFAFGSNLKNDLQYIPR